MKKVVIGLGFGDEGKGLVTDWLAGKNSSAVVTRYSGGHQAGHCVHRFDKKHIFSNFGSGTLNGNYTNWEAKTFDPIGFWNEFNDLKSENITPSIYVNPKCPVTTPYEKVRNHKRATNGGHGSVGVGYSDTLRREEANYHLYFGDILNRTIFNIKFSLIQEYYKKNGIEVEQSLIDEFLDICDRVGFWDSFVNPYPFKSSVEIYESSQGLLLDMDYGFFPYATYGRLGTQEINVDDTTEYFLVTRAYQTRHGFGPNSEEPIAVNNKNETNIENFYQKEFRVTVLDLDMLKYSMEVDDNIRKSNNKNLVITCLDHMTEFKLKKNGDVIGGYNLITFIKEIKDYVPRVKDIYMSFGPSADDVVRCSFFD